MRIRRRLPVFVGFLLVAAAVALVVFLRKHAPPEAARLLPTADGFIYINLRGLRRANVGAQLPPSRTNPNTRSLSRGLDFSSSATSMKLPSPFTIRPQRRWQR